MISRRTLLGSGAALGAASALAACSKNSSSSTSGGLDTLTIMAPVLTGQTPAADGKLQKAIEDFSGKKLAMTWVPNSDYGNKTNVILAGSELPELMVIQGKTPTFVRSAQAGAFWDLTGRLEQYPNLKPVDTTAAAVKNATINGKLYGVPRLRDPMRTGVILRKDWLAKLGLSMPKSTDDLYGIVKAFSERDPDGNGQKDTYGLIIPKWPGGYGTTSPYDVFETWFGAPNAWGERSGKLSPGFDTPEYLQADQFLKKWVDEKLINPDFATLDSAKWNDPFFNGKGGVIVDVTSRGQVIGNLFKQQHPSNYMDYVAMTGNLTGPSGKLYAYPTIGYAGFISVSRQSIKTEAQLDQVLQFLDKMSSKEGQILENNGISGLNFTPDGTYSVAIKGGDADVVTNDTQSFAQIGTNTNGFMGYTAKPATPAEQAFYEDRLKFQAADFKSAVQNPANALVSDTYTAKGAQLDQIIADARLKYIAGQLSLDQYQAEIKRWHTEGGDQVISEMNDLYAKYK